jgi:hypothetical protein
LGWQAQTGFGWDVNGTTLVHHFASAGYRIGATKHAVTARGQRPQRCGAAANKGNSSRGTNRAAGRPLEITKTPDSSGVWVRERRKRSEPHGRYQVAIHLELARRASRHGGETPRRRNMAFGWHRVHKAAVLGRLWAKPARWVSRWRGRRMTRIEGSASASTSVDAGDGPAL